MARRMSQKRVAATAIPVSAVDSSPEALLERFKDFPAIDVVKRRFSNPNDPGSLPILLKDEAATACTNSEHINRLRFNDASCRFCGRPVRQWFVYWANTSREGRWANIKAKGYVPVEVSDLQDENEVADRVKHPGDNYVRRGDSGKEILCKQPLMLWLHIQRQQEEVRAARFGSKKAVAADLAESAGREFGDEAGQSLHDGGISIESMRRTKSTLGAEAQDDDRIDA